MEYIQQAPDYLAPPAKEGTLFRTPPAVPTSPPAFCKLLPRVAQPGDAEGLHSAQLFSSCVFAADSPRTGLLVGSEHGIVSEPGLSGAGAGNAADPRTEGGEDFTTGSLAFPTRAVLSEYTEATQTDAELYTHANIREPHVHIACQHWFVHAGIYPYITPDVGRRRSRDSST